MLLKHTRTHTQHAHIHTQELMLLEQECGLDPLESDSSSHHVNKRDSKKEKQLALDDQQSFPSLGEKTAAASYSADAAEGEVQQHADKEAAALHENSDRGNWAAAARRGDAAVGSAGVRAGE